MPPELTRRSFVLGAAAMAGLAACGGGGSGSGSSAAKKGPFNILVTSFLMQPNVDQRVGLVMASPDGGFVTPNGPVQVAFAPNAAKGPGRFGTFSDAEVHNDTNGAPAYIRASTQFPQPGTYWVRVRYNGGEADAALTVGDPEAAQVPKPGAPMVSTPTPIPTDHRGVEPICTRTPQCPWHTPSLDVALGAHRPIALLFATPRLCQTQTCGPVLDSLLSLKDQFESKVQFLHAEIYTDGSGNSTNLVNAPAVLAYHLPGEPVLFLAGADGVVRERIDGLFGAAEASAALGRLVAA